MDPKTKRVLIYVGAGCGVLTLAVCCVAAAGMYYCKASWDDTDQAAKAFVLDLRKGDVEGAYGRTTASYKKAHGLAAFRARLDEAPAFTHHTSAIITQHFFQPGAVLLGGMLSTHDGTVPFHVELEKEEDGRWGVADFGRGLATPH